MLLLGGLFQFFLKAAAQLVQLALPDFDVAFPLLEFVFQLAFLIEQVILALEQNLLFLGLGLLTGLFHNALGQLIGVADALGGHPAVNQRAGRHPHQDGRRKRENEQKIHETSLSL